MGSELIGLLDQAIGEVVGDFQRLVLVEAVGADQFCEKTAVDAAGDVVARRAFRPNPVLGW
jgi:hypothetical protein